VRDTRARWSFALAGLLLIAAQALLAPLSARFAYEASVRSAPVLAVVAVLVAAGGILCLLAPLLRDAGRSPWLLLWLILAGLLMRLAAFFSTPILEDDFYRYLWDGAVLAHGFDPYAYAPADVARGDAPAALVRLGEQAPLVLARINYPELSTVYPPLAQAGFALAHWLDPWSLGAWRGLLLVAESATLALLLALLAQAGRSPLWAALYWWNPLIVKELVNSAHVDALLLPLLAGALLLAARRRATGAALLVALASGVKLWPALLLPLVSRAAGGGARAAIGPALAGAALAAAIVLPMLLAGLDRRSGLVAYATSWQMNDLLFMIIVWSVTAVLQAAGGLVEHAQTLARLSVGAVVAAVALAAARAAGPEPEALARRSLAVAATLLLLAPAVFPWYYAWLMPFLVLAPRASLLLLGAMLPLYYARSHLAARGQAALFDHGLVWFEFAPVLCLLAVEWWRGFRRAR